MDLSDQAREVDGEDEEEDGDGDDKVSLRHLYPRTAQEVRVLLS